MKKLMASLLVLAASGCPNVEVDTDEIHQTGPVVEFDPARSQLTGARYLPFPNDLVRDPKTGKLSLGTQACENPASALTRTNVLNKLDGFGTYEVGIQISLTAPADAASLPGRVVLYKMTGEQAPLTKPVPTVVRVGTTRRFSNDDCANPETVNTIVIVPTVPLDDKSTYVYALRRGIVDGVDGTAFEPALTWSLVASTTPPVVLDAQGNVVSDRTPLDPADPADRASLVSLAGLYRAHQRPLNFLEQAGIPRSEVLVAAAFTTQTIIDPLDPTVAGSPANKLPASGFASGPVGPIGGTAFGPAAALCAGSDTPAECFLKLALGGCSPLTTGCSAANYTVGAGACGTPPAGIYDCSAVGALYSGVIVTDNYQAQLDNNGSSVKLQGPWSDPVHPMKTGDLPLQTYIAVPTGAAPATGWPVVIFGHGLASNRENIFAIAGRLARAGFATVTIDFVAHGSRAVKTSSDAALGCKGKCYDPSGVEQATFCTDLRECNFAAGHTCGTVIPSVTSPKNPPTPGSAPQCYSQIFSADLANTRDNIRQTILDLQRVAKVVKFCGTTGCGPLKVNTSRIYYGGISLGSIIGSSAASLSPEIKAASLSVGGAGWLDILENTAAVPLRCGLVNNLIDAGILTGAKWNGVSGAGATGLCVEDNGNAWKAQPGYAVFGATARWVLDAADPANLIGRLQSKKALIQKVIDDEVIPNVTTDRMAQLLNITMPKSASPYNPGAPTVESAALLNARASIQVNYASDTNFMYTHGSLLKPATSTPATKGQLGTMRLQIDFAQYLDNADDSNL
jgi:dienelactone hydrolase